MLLQLKHLWYTVHSSTKVHKLMYAAFLLQKREVEDAERKVIILPILVGGRGRGGVLVTGAFTYFVSTISTIRRYEH
jgi:hypothetical protein